VRDASQPSAPPPPVMLGLPGPCTHPCTAESLGTRTRPNNGTEGGGATPEAAAETDTARPGAGHLGSPRPQAGSSTAPPLCAYRSTRSDQSTGKPVAIDSCACVLETASLRAGRHGTVQSPQSSVERSACPLGVLECSRWTTRVRAPPLGWRCPDANHHRGHTSATSRLHLGHISATSRLYLAPTPIITASAPSSSVTSGLAPADSAAATKRCSS